MNADLGVIYTLSAANILTSYVQSSTVVNGGRPSYFRFTVRATTIVTTSITSVTFKFQGAKTSALLWEDIASTDDAYASPATVEQVLTITAAGTAQELSVIVPGGFPYIQFAVKVAGGVGQALEKIELEALAF